MTEHAEDLPDEAVRALVLRTASKVATDILLSETGIDALRRIVDAARTLTGARYGALGVANPHGDGLELFVTSGLSPDEETAIGTRPHGVGVLGLLLTQTRPLRLADVKSHPDSIGFPANHPPMRAFLGVPIRNGDRVLGSLYLTEKAGDAEFTGADAVAVDSLGAHAAVAIHNLHLLQRQRTLLAGLLSAQEEERRALAYELHDSLTQLVLASHAHLDAFRHARSAGNAARAERELETGLRYLHDAVGESRRLVNGLRSLALDDLGLAGALELLLNEEKTRADWDAVRMENHIGSRRYERGLESTLYRIAQEALTNARKHARATEVVLTLRQVASTDEPARLSLAIADDGVGFARKDADPHHRRIGLHSMTERAQLVGGLCEIQSAPGSGTRVTALFPVRAQEPAELP